MRKTMQFLKNVVGMSDTANNFATEIKSVISGFEEEDFLAWVEDRFGKFQKSWNKGAVEELHPFETEKMFEMQKLYFKEAKEKGIETGMDAASVKESKIAEFYNKKDKYEIVVQIKANVRNEEDAVSEACHYYLTFEKEKQNKNLLLCPCCTAPVALNATQCEYCHTNFPAAMDQWLLAKIDMA